MTIVQIVKECKEPGTQKPLRPGAIVVVDDRQAVEWIKTGVARLRPPIEPKEKKDADPV